MALGLPGEASGCHESSTSTAWDHAWLEAYPLTLQCISPVQCAATLIVCLSIFMQVMLVFMCVLHVCAVR